MGHTTDAREEEGDYIAYYDYFVFSSRRRHTRWPRDWSSDVCSSDLTGDNFRECSFRSFHHQLPVCQRKIDAIIHLIPVKLILFRTFRQIGKISWDPIPQLFRHFDRQLIIVFRDGITDVP